MSPRQTMSLGDTLLQLLFLFIVNTLYGAYLPRSYVGSDSLLRQHFPENVYYYYYYYYYWHHHATYIFPDTAVTLRTVRSVVTIPVRGNRPV